jgi:antitoxin HicB
MKAQNYAIEIRPLADEDGGGFVALVPQLPGCMSDGETPGEALANAYDAIDCWIDATVKMGREVPAPKVYA